MREYLVWLFRKDGSFVPCDTRIGAPPPLRYAFVAIERGNVDLFLLKERPIRIPQYSAIYAQFQMIAGDRVAVYKEC